ncbi:hypothetical protein HDF15_003295 [Granulicella mallensis]|uniref:Uncharacterized protein n=1 Tax=Granulicella mallensis TaxID=940614 RepID=A0A7W7ZSE5_9BACT|nr:hypothetical protein [Granulicella mallensis]
MKILRQALRSDWGFDAAGNDDRVERTAFERDRLNLRPEGRGDRTAIF